MFGFLQLKLFFFHGISRIFFLFQMKSWCVFASVSKKLVFSQMFFLQICKSLQALTKLLSFLYSRDITVQIMKLFRCHLPFGIGRNREVLVFVGRRFLGGEMCDVLGKNFFVKQKNSNYPTVEYPG